MRYLSIKNFEQYQHYKDRRPPWIKLHVALLDDYDFGQLSDTGKAHLMLLWVLASKHENKIPHDLAWITQRIAATDPVDVEELILRGFLEPHDEKRAKGKLEGWASRYVSAQTRAAVFQAANHHCAACDATEKLEIDHIKPISKGGTGDPSNLQVLCRQCNRRKRVTLAEQDAGHLRSDLLHTPKNQRSPETERETEKRQRKKLPVASGEARPASWVAEGVEWWIANVGHITHPRFGQALTGAVGVHGWPSVFPALKCYVEDVKSRGKPAKPEWCAAEIVKWVEWAGMPATDDTGLLTPRGKAIMGLA